MPDPNIDLTDAAIPKNDGESNEYAYKEALSSGDFNRNRRVIFINGMLNAPRDHAESALALSWVQMCTVVGVYNASGGGLTDLGQCLGDKAQFNGPTSFSAKNKVFADTLFGGISAEESIRRALSRNRAQVALFDLLRRSENRSCEIFAHSQGNLILSNVLQAIAAADGKSALSGKTIHTFGSPAVSWPSGIAKYEHGFTWDPVTFLAGFDMSWSISKVGMPSGSFNPITHSFLQYLFRDPAFVVNRYRIGGLGITFRMDEDGLAAALAAMGTNTRRVQSIFEYLDRNHNSDADDVTVRYVDLIKSSGSTINALKANRTLIKLLIKVMDEGVTTQDEKKAIAFLTTL